MTEFLAAILILLALFIFWRIKVSKPFGDGPDMNED